MKSLKKTLVLLVVLSMILSAVSPVFAFNDVISEDYAEQANKMGAFGVFAGDAEGNFKAEENITRAEMAVIIGKLMGLTANEADANKGYASNFSDVAAGDWYTGWVNLVAGRGIISGFPDGTFRPNEKVTQAQAVTMIVKALGWGVVVDQTGTWPANYITKASELRLFKNAVETNSELVTRGNVAIYCYNALTAKTWDVTSSEDGKLTSSKTNDTILAKYFSDFVNEDGEMKLVEDVTVDATGATTTKIGANQVELSVPTDTFKNDKGTDIGLAGFIDAEDEPRKGKEEVTYAKGTSVVAYVPTEVANIANLSNKKVDVIFGKDNEVAYLVVTSDVLDNSFVTAWDYDVNAEDETTIEIDGEEYEFVYDSKATTKSQVEVSVFGVKIGTGVSTINTLFGNSKGNLNCLYKGDLTRNVVADITLSPDDEIEAINFKFSAEYANTGITVAEKIVEKVTAKKFEYANGNVAISTLEDEEPRVVRNNEVASLEDIEAGDVLTIITAGTDNMVIYAVSNTVEGTLADYTAKTNALEVDGNEYKVVVAPYYNVEGETDDYTETTASTLLTSFEDEDVTVYMNMFGEVVAVVGESEATGMTLGVITSAETTPDEDDDDVEYLKVKILAENGTNRSYKIYNSNTKKSIKKADEWTNVISKLKAKDIVVFSADADRVIKSDDIEVVKDGEYTISDNQVIATAVTSATADIDNERLTVDGTPYKYSDSTVIINYNTAKEELISWDAFTNATETSKLSTTTFTMFTKGTKLVYVVADVANYGVSETEYGIITDFDRDYDEDGDRIYLVKVLVDGAEETYECSSDLREYFVVGDFIAFNVSDGIIKEDYTVGSEAPAFAVYYDVVDDFEELIDEDTIADTILANIATGLKTDLSGKKLEYIKVDAFDGEAIEFKYSVAEVKCECGSTKDCTQATHTTTACTECGSAVACTKSHTGLKPETTAYRIADLDEDYVVYNVVTGEMGEISEDDYVLVLNTDSDATDYEIVVIVK